MKLGDRVYKKITNLDILIFLQENCFKVITPFVLKTHKDGFEYASGIQPNELKKQIKGDYWILENDYNFLKSFTGKFKKLISKDLLVDFQNFLILDNQLDIHADEVLKNAEIFIRD